MKDKNVKFKRVKTSAVVRKASSLDKNFRSSSFYNFFRSHRVSEKRFGESFFGRLLNSTRLYIASKTFKNSFAQKTETSFFISRLRDLFEGMLLCNFRNYASVLLYFSIYSFAVSMSGYTLGQSSATTVGDIYSALILLVISLILLPLKGSLYDIMSKSRILAFISDKFFFPISFSKESELYTAKTYTGITMLAGTFLGLLTSMISIKTILSFMFLFFLVLLLFKTPENALPILILCGMWASEKSLAVLCLISFDAYLFKVLRGKRNFELKYFDILFLLFVLILGMSCFNSTGNGFFDKYTLINISYCAVYFIYRNCVKNDAASKKIINSVVMCGMISALTILYSRFFAWGYADIVRKYTGVSFKMPDVNLFSLCGFLLIIFPFILSSLASAKYNSGKIFALITAFLSIAALLSTGVKGHILGVAVCVLIYVVSSFRNPFTSLLTVLIVYVLLSVIITNAPFLGNDRFLSVSDYTKSMTATTSEIISDNFVSGIGIGRNNFSQIFSAYTHFAEGKVLYSNNIFLQAVACLGIFGSIFAAALLLNYYKMQFTSISENRKKSIFSSLIATSSVASVSTLLLRGFTDYPLSNFRVTFMLIVILGFSAAIYYRNTNDLDLLYEE